MTNHTTHELQPQLPFDEIPYGCCHCGCGKKTAISQRNNAKFGHVKGEPVRFVPGHNQRLNKRDAARRFWAKVDRRGPDECWEWQAARSTHGYGIFRDNGRNHIASRYAYQLHHGDISDGNHILHSCDNPPCCNPGHLRQGTQHDNVHDAIQRERRSDANYTDTDVMKWLHLFKESGLTVTVFARQQGLNGETLRYWIDTRGPNIGVFVKRQKLHRYTNEQVLDLWQWFVDSGLSGRAFSKTLGLEDSTVRTMFRRRGLIR